MLAFSPGLYFPRLSPPEPPMHSWILVLYFMGLNLSNEQIARESDLDPDDTPRMAGQSR